MVTNAPPTARPTTRTPQACGTPSRLAALGEPLGYVDGQNLYEYVRSSPTDGVDPSGTERVDARNSVEEILAALRKGIAEMRASTDWKVAPALLEHWLGCSGEDVWVSADWLKDHHVRLAAKYIRETLVPEGGKSPDTDRAFQGTLPKYFSKPNASIVTDHWDRGIQSTLGSNELSYASGTSTLQGQCIFTSPKGGLVKGYIRYLWYDHYNWHAGLNVRLGKHFITDRAMLKLKDAGKGKDFMVFGMWIEEVTYARKGGRWTVESVREITPLGEAAAATQPATRPSSQPSRPTVALKGSESGPGAGLPAELSLSPPVFPPVFLSGRRVVWGGTLVVSRRYRGRPWGTADRYWELDKLAPKRTITVPQ